MTTATTKDYITQKTVFLNIKGEIHNQNALIFKKNIFSIPEDKKYLVLDLSSLNSLSGDGIRVFAESIRYFSKRGGVVILIQPKEEIVLLLKFLKLIDSVIICEDYIKAKEIIENSIENKNFIIQIEEKKLLFEQNKGVDELDKETKEELKLIKQNLLNLNQKFSNINKKLEDKEIEHHQNDDKIYNILEQKINEIKKSNESYFEEFQIRINHLNEAQKELIHIIQDLKTEFQDIKQEIIEIRTANKSNQSIKKIDGFYILNCPKCGQALRIKQWGKHLCPKCQTKFNVLLNGDIEIFDHL